MTAKIHSILKKTAVIFLSALAVLLCIKFIIPTFWPFILAFLMALMLDPIIKKLCKKFMLKRSFASAFTVTLFLALLIGCSAFILLRLFSVLSEHLKTVPDKLSRIYLPSTDLPRRIEGIVSALPEELTKIFKDMLDGIRNQTAELPSKLYSRAFDFLSNAAAKAPDVIFSTLMLALALYFFSGSLPSLKSFLLPQLPEKVRGKSKLIKGDILSTLKGWGCAQLKLMGLCFVELTAAFLIMRLKNAVLVAAGIAIIDALPVFGIGLALIPWTIFSFITGNYHRAVLLGLTYATINLVRSILEPRLLGSQTGLHPAATLITVYAGYRVSGVGGMILFPISLMLLKQFNDRGWIKLWK